MKKLIILFAYFLITKTSISQNLPKPGDSEVWNPEPTIVTPGYNNGPPSDAIVLFDGSDFSKWKSIKNDQPIKWTINPDGSMTVKPGSGDIITKEEHGSVQLHIEWKSPIKITDDGQGRGNSGIYLQRRYEIQILDSNNNRTYSNGQASSIYKQHMPLVNAMRPTGEWQVYDIVFIEPKFNSNGDMVESGYITVFHNGILVQNNAEILGTTENIGPPKRRLDQMSSYTNLLLQDHNDCCNFVSFRNIWMRKI